MPPLPPPVSAEIGQIALVVRDVAGAKRFYTEALGLQPLFDAGPNLAFLGAGAVRVMLSQPEGGREPGRNSIIYLRTPAVAASYETALAQGAAAESGPRLIARMPDHELWMAFVRDPDGNLVGFMEERR